MRISTSMIYDQGVTTIQNQLSDLLKVQQQVATGRRVLTPSDDPIAAARTLDVEQLISRNEQYIRNSDQAMSDLQLQESVLSSVVGLLQDVRNTVLTAGNPLLAFSDRKNLAAALQGNYDQLLGLANTMDANGQHMFSGYKGGTQPFSQTAPGTVVYNGDQGQRLIQISASRQIAVSSNGADVFQLIRNGNGTFATAAASTNTGTGVVSSGVVLDPSRWSVSGNNKNFTIKFDVSAALPPVTTYDIVDNVSGDSLLTGVAAAATGPYLRIFISGSTISLKTQAPPDTTLTPFDYGAELSVRGAPVTGDTFSVKASTSQDIFTTLQNLISSLQSSGNNAAITNGNNAALDDLALAMEKVLTVRTAVGTSMNEVETQRNASDDMNLQYRQRLSGLQDLDYAKGITDLTQKQANLEAAQKSFLKVQGLSLFNII